MSASLFKSREYQALLTRLKQRIQEAQVRAGLAVNRELVLLYWSIGREILARQQEQGWGAKIIDALARDLRRAFPAMQGLSPRNLKYMRAFAEAWPDEAIVQQLVAQIPWGHNVRLAKLVMSPEGLRWCRAANRDTPSARVVQAEQSMSALGHRPGLGSAHSGGSPRSASGDPDSRRGRSAARAPVESDEYRTRRLAYRPRLRAR